MDDLFKLLISSGIGCFIDNVCFNHVFYADDLCLMAPCAIALQELLHICHNYSISVDVNFNALKSFCFAFTPKPFKLSLPQVTINSAHIPYTDSIKYLGFTFASSHKDDNEILRQMRMLYARSNRHVRLFHVSFLQYVFVDPFTVVTCGHNTKNYRFLKFVWHTTTYTEQFYMFLVAAVQVQCLCRITFLILSV